MCNVQGLTDSITQNALNLSFVVVVVCKLKKKSTHPPPTFLSLEPSSTHFANIRLTDVKLQLLTY